MDAAYIAGQVIVYVLLAAVYIFFSVIAIKFMILVPNYLKKIAEAQETLFAQSSHLKRIADALESKENNT